MAAKKTSIPIRFKKLRHWKQRFDKNAKFVWRRSLKFGGTMTKIGSQIPKSLLIKPTKLRRFWEAGVIELRDFEAPKVSTGKVVSKQAKAAKAAKKRAAKEEAAALELAEKEAADKDKGGDPVPKESTNDETT